MAHIVLSAAITQGVLITTTEERAEKLRNFAEEVCRGTGLKAPEVRVYSRRPTPNDGLKVTFTVIDEFWKQEE
jgi:hypothetical protein